MDNGRFAFQGEIKLILGLNPMAIHAAIKDGFAYSVFEDVANEIAVTQKELARIIGIPVETIARRKDINHLTSIESDRLYRIILMVDFTCTVFGNINHARAWLKTPNLSLHGEVPLSLMCTDAGMHLVETSLYRIKYGIWG
jgi:putative toxin-antitoxin system antitoxin component (TIGR02293 family)